MHDLEPLAERLVGVFEDGPGDMGEPIASIRGAGVALPLEGHRPDREDFYSATARANDAFGPSTGDQIRLACILIPGRKHGLKLGFGHLVNWLWTLGHDGLPINEGKYGI
jgi:hypothetical protein